jgi:signal transduction histidine kinase
MSHSTPAGDRSPVVGATTERRCAPMILWVLWIVIWVVFLTAGAVSIAAPLPKSILLLNESEMVGPFYRDAYEALRSTVTANSSQPISIFLEQLALERFGGDRYAKLLKTFFESKYRDEHIGVIVVLGFGALDFVLRLRAEMWSGVPVVFTMVDEADLQGLTLPRDVTDRTSRVKFQDLVNAARAVVPHLQRIAIVGDRWETQTAYRHLKTEIAVAPTSLEIIDLVGLPMRQLRERVALLPERTAIVYTSIFSDGEGTSYPPTDALGFVAEVANRPIVIAAETFLGHGGIGGYVLTPAAIGKEAADLALRILNGESPSAIPIAEGDVVRPIFDWRQFKRWGVSESRLPPGSEIRFRDPTAWEQYRSQIVMIAGGLLAQLLLIVGLLYERRRRRYAEVESRRRLSELAHINRSATAGELSASIAHEVRQPLASIAANGSAALRWLRRATPDLDEVQAALERVVGEAHRASDVLGTIRSMFKKSDQKKGAVDVNILVEEVLTVLHGELLQRRILVETRLGVGLPEVVANRVQLQQVILNLLVNAADAMNSVAERDRVLKVTSEKQNPASVLIKVEDSGPGVEPKDIERIFEPFYTTKTEGMGMGLAICRSIVESHGGRLTATPGHTCGLIMQVSLSATANGGALLAAH